MTTPTRHRGAGVHEAPELLIRQMLMEGLVELAGDRERLQELFQRPDDLRQGSQEEWLRDMMAAVARMVQPGPTQVRVGVGYPPVAARLPYLSIIVDSGSENAGGASMGDVLGRHYEQHGTPSALDPTTSRSVRHTVTGVDYTTNVQVGSWTTAPEEASALSAVAKHLLFRHKGRLAGAGVRELSLSESGFQPDPQMYPHTAYVPIVRVTLEWTWRQTRRTSPVPTRVTMRPGTFTVRTE